MVGESGQEGTVPFPNSIEGWRRDLASPEKDLAVFKSITSLRESVEKPEDWAKTKGLAKKELETVPDDIIPKIFESLIPIWKFCLPVIAKGICTETL